MMKLIDAFRNFGKRLKIKEKLHYVIGCLQSTHNLDCDILGSDAAYFDSDLPTFLWKELP